MKDGRLVESITFDWCTPDKAEEHIRAVLASKHVDIGPVRPRTNHGKVCHLCR